MRIKYYYLLDIVKKGYNKVLRKEIVGEKTEEGEDIDAPIVDMRDME